MSTVHTVIGSVFGSGNGARSNGINPKNMISDDPDYCSHCESTGKVQKKMSCWMLIFLLAIDALTIGLLLMLFYNSHSNGENRQDTLPAKSLSAPASVWSKTTLNQASLILIKCLNQLFSFSCLFYFSCSAFLDISGPLFWSSYS